MTYPETFEAVGIVDFDKPYEPKRFEFKPQPFRDHDLDIKIECCGVCGSDLHAVDGVWGKPDVSIAVGHEIIGEVVRVGPKAKEGIKVGDRVGVSAICDTDGSCVACKLEKENYCDNRTLTYMAKIEGTDDLTQGGNASHIRVNSKWAFKIPDGLESVYAAPLLCGGVTGFAPLLDHGIKAGDKVGIIGIGGIGHMTVLFAKALGCEVTVISRGRSKEEDARKLGADHYIASSEPNAYEGKGRTLDFIINTSFSVATKEMGNWMSLLKPKANLNLISFPENFVLNLDPWTLFNGGNSVGVSALGSPNQIDYMLEFAAKHNIKPWVEVVDINEKNLGETWKRLKKGDVKYRFTLTGYDKFFKA